MRDCSGLEEREDDSELDSAGPGDCGSDSFALAVIGSEERRVRCPSGLTGNFSGLGEAPPGGLWPGTVVAADELREICGLPKASFPGDAGTLPSFLGSGESFRTDRAEGALPPPDPVLLMASATAAADSDPGIGDGADEPLAAVALRIWARTWEVCRSVR